MSLIYVGTDSNSNEAAVDALYHNMEVESPRWPRASKAAGLIRYEMFISGNDTIETIYVGIPYQNIIKIEDSSREFVDNFSDRIIGKQKNNIFDYNGSEYQLQDLCQDDFRITDAEYDDIEYKIITIEMSGTDTHTALSFKIQVNAMAVNVADSLLAETTWSLDVTLYGPVNPREHSFLNENQMNVNIFDVKSGYSYLYLPENTFPKIVDPDPLESFYRESHQRFYYTWVIGNLDPWYEQRIMITYGSHGGNYLTAIILSVIASLIFLFISAAPDLATTAADTVIDVIRTVISWLQGQELSYQWLCVYPFS